MQKEAPKPAKGRALLFGLNYSYESCKLQGCINDVLNTVTYLKQLKQVAFTDIKVCTDDTEQGRRDCMAQNLIRNLYELALQSHSEQLDFVWIHYSGHGSQTLDRNKEELDGMDECLVPSDFRKSGLVPDDIVMAVLRYMNPKTKVVCVFDCCHSGTIADVKYSWEGPNKCTVENILCNVPAKVLCLSGCRDDQVSMDALDSQAQAFSGALTSCLLTVLCEASSSFSFSSSTTDVNNAFVLLDKLRLKLRERGFAQMPKLTTTYNLAREPAFI